MGKVRRRGATRADLRRTGVAYQCTESGVHSIVRGEIASHALLRDLTVPRGTVSVARLAWLAISSAPLSSERLTQYTDGSRGVAAPGAPLSRAASIRRTPAAMLFVVLCAGVVRAQEPVADAVLDPVVVTATRRVEKSLDVPASVDVIGTREIQQSQPMVNLSESLVRVPGIVANNRQNYAQDLQISSRGFGARAAFGVRGLRLYQDDIPQTMPDGQGQTGSFALLATERIEVLRGPFSTLVRQRVRRRDHRDLGVRHRGSGGDVLGRRRQLRHLDARGQGHRDGERRGRRGRGEPLLDRRLPRPQRSAPRTGRGQGHAAAGRAHAAHLARHLAVAARTRRTRSGSRARNGRPTRARPIRPRRSSTRASR